MQVVGYCRAREFSPAYGATACVDLDARFVPLLVYRGATSRKWT